MTESYSPSDKARLRSMVSEGATWSHAGGKLRECGAPRLSDAEILAILISPGIKGRSAEAISQEILARFGSFRGMANQPMAKLLKIRGLGETKVTRIAAAFELARRIVDQVLQEKEDEAKS